MSVILITQLYVRRNMCAMFVRMSSPASEALSEFSSLISPLGDLDLDLGDLDLGDLDLDGLDLGLRKTGFGRLKREFLRPRGLAETLGSCSAMALPFSSPS